MDIAITMERDRPAPKFYVAESKALKNGDIESYVSTEDPDRVGDVILASGWDIENFRKTGSPVLFGHHYGITPGGGIPLIGNAVEMEVQRKGLWSVTRFHEKTQLSREAALLARDGHMPSWSVGFDPKSQPEVRKGEKDEFLGFIFKDAELLEYSLVPVPANPEARSRAAKMYQKGLISMETWNMVREHAAFVASPSPLAEKDCGDELAGVAEYLKTRIAVREFSRRAGR